MMAKGCPKIIDDQTTMFPHRGPKLISINLDINDSGICAIIPVKAQIWNVFKGTLTYKSN